MLNETTKDLRFVLDKIKERIDYRLFYRRYCSADIALHPTGGRLQAHCPIPKHHHTGQGHPSLSIDLQRGLFHCFSRNEGGDAIRFYELVHEVSFKSAVRELARELKIHPHDFAGGAQKLTLVEPANTLQKSLERQSPNAVCEVFLDVCRLEDQSEGINYLVRRGINAKTAGDCGVSYFPRRAYQRVMRRMSNRFSPDELQLSGLFNVRARLTFYRHRLLFPLYLEQRLVYLQARTIAPGVEPRWCNIRGSIPSLYNADAVAQLPTGSVVYLVEGFTDTLTLISHGFAAIGIIGAGGLKEEWLPELARFCVVAALDPDGAGQRATARYREIFAARRMRFAHLNLPSDINDFFRHRPAAALELTLLTEAALEAES